jgi:hypothetical protein
MGESNLYVLVHNDLKQESFIMQMDQKLMILILEVLRYGLIQTEIGFLSTNLKII